MSTLNGGPGIVTDGLVLYIDAANSYSYVSGSTAWNDLSRGNTTGTLINSPTFTGSFGGAIFTENASSYINTNYTLPTNNFTVSVVYRCTSFGAWSGIWASEVWNNGTGFVTFFETETSVRFVRGGLMAGVLVDASSSLLNHLTFTLTSQSTGSIYVNGSLRGTAALPTASAVEKPILLSTRYNNNGVGITDRRPAIIPLFQVYNRVLTPDEILQNYNAQKSRFGL